MDTDLKRPYPSGIRVEVDFRGIGMGWRKGVVINIPYDKRQEPVVFDEPDEMFHNLVGNCKEGYGWFCGHERVRLLKKEIENDPEYEGLFI